MTASAPYPNGVRLSLKADAYEMELRYRRTMANIAGLSQKLFRLRMRAG